MVDILSEKIKKKLREETHFDNQSTKLCQVDQWHMMQSVWNLET